MYMSKKFKLDHRSSYRGIFKRLAVKTGVTSRAVAERIKHSHIETMRMYIEERIQMDREAASRDEMSREIHQ